MTPRPSRERLRILIERRFAAWCSGVRLSREHGRALLGPLAAMGLSLGSPGDEVRLRVDMARVRAWLDMHEAASPALGENDGGAEV